MTKDGRELDMYFARGILPGLLADPGQVPPPAFVRHYRTYFQRDLPAFPGCLIEPAAVPGRVSM